MKIGNETELEKLESTINITLSGDEVILLMQGKIILNKNNEPDLTIRWEREYEK